MSAGFTGNASKLVKFNFPGRPKEAHNLITESKFKPVPNPNSAILKPSINLSYKSLPLINTYWDSAKPPSAEKYGS